jgi:hypothetical protein
LAASASGASTRQKTRPSPSSAKAAGLLATGDEYPYRAHVNALGNPVAQVVDVVAALGGQIGLVRLGDVVHGDARAEVVDVHEERHQMVLPKESDWDASIPIHGRVP